MSRFIHKPTPRQQEFLRLVAQGASDQEIAAALVITENSVRDHFKRLFKRTGLHSRNELARWARQFFPDIPTPSGLTKREQEIAKLAVQGLYNKEIAARLGISENTARDELSTVFRKLGIRSRVELATWWREHSK